MQATAGRLEDALSKSAAPPPQGVRMGCKDLEYNWLGTDDQGRDVVARLIYGFRISVLFGLTLTIISSVIGVAAGAVQGYFGGWTDLLFQRVIEIWTSIPSLYLLLIISSVLVPGFFVLLGILLLFSWVSLVGLVRAEFLRGRNFEYIQAARALGVSNATIMFRHLLPNAMVATMTFLPFIVSSSVMTLTALDFLGFGLPPGSPSLGELLSQGKANIQAPWLGLCGFFTVAFMLSLLIFIGEAVRDAFDPRKTFGREATLNTTEIQNQKTDAVRTLAWIGATIFSALVYGCVMGAITQDQLFAGIGSELFVFMRVGFLFGPLAFVFCDSGSWLPS